MSVSLADLLAQYQIRHPTQLASAKVEDSALRLSLRGCPWWKGEKSREVGDLEMIFSGLGEGMLELGAFSDSNDDEFLEDFSVSLTSSLAWARSERSTIYCYAPLRDPFRVMDLVQKHLRQSGSPFGLESLLHAGQTLEDFSNLASSSVFLLTTGPDKLQTEVAAELDRQGVPFSLHPGQARSYPPLFVTLGGGWFFCEAATAEWRD